MFKITIEQLVILVFFIQLIWADHASKRSNRATEATKGYKDDDYGDTDYYYQDDKVNPNIFENLESTQVAVRFQKIVLLIDFLGFVNGAEHNDTNGK